MEETVDAAAQAVGRFLDRLRRRQHGIGRLVHVGDGAGHALQHGDDRFRAQGRGRDVIRYLACGRVLLLD